MLPTATSIFQAKANMRLSRVNIFASTTIILLLFVLLILWLAIKSSFGFFLVGSCFAVLIFIILIWALALHYGQSTIVGVGVNLVSSVLAIILLTMVIMFCVRLSSSTTFVVCAVVDLVVALAMAASFLVPKVISYYKRNHWLILEEDLSQLEFSFLGQAVGGLPRRFRYEELKVATNNFQTVIGRGGSGSVFKGVLGDGFPIAVKRIEGELYGQREFRSEITAIVSVQHVNLIRILGYCLVSGGYRYLVYEFMQNGSLDSWIFPNINGGVGEKCLPWAKRYQVAIDVAKALNYLHNDSHSKILHLDVKPHNILLDENYGARVSDFGISRVMERDESRVVTTIRGTRGYLAPEWFSGAGISEKSDVYSYGMVLLELVGGRKNVQFIDNGNESQMTWSYFPKTAGEKMREGKLIELVDERLMRHGGVEEEELRTLVYVALWCIQERANLRPSMELVVSMLKGHVAVDMPPETRMFLVDLVVPIDTETGSGSSKVTPTSTTLTNHSSIPKHSISISTRFYR